MNQYTLLEQCHFHVACWLLAHGFRGALVCLGWKQFTDMEIHSQTTGRMEVVTVWAWYPRVNRATLLLQVLGGDGDSVDFGLNKGIMRCR